MSDEKVKKAAKKSFFEKLGLDRKSQIEKMKKQNKSDYNKKAMEKAKSRTYGD
jgi:hypothetical protein